MGRDCPRLGIGDPNEPDARLQVIADLGIDFRLGIVLALHFDNELGNGLQIAFTRELDRQGPLRDKCYVAADEPIGVAPEDNADVAAFALTVPFLLALIHKLCSESAFDAAMVSAARWHDD